MVRLDEYSLICDFAETYHILDWRSLPGRLAATLAVGLRENSRIKMKLAGVDVPAETLLQAITADALRVLVWMQTQDGAKGRNAPAMLTESLCGKNRKEEGHGFESPEDFMAWRDSMIGGEANV